MIKNNTVAESYFYGNSNSILIDFIVLTGGLHFRRLWD